ncbi:MAG: hypothetical protein V4850_14080 [Myxococcota bacterium]
MRLSLLALLLAACTSGKTDDTGMTDDSGTDDTDTDVEEADPSIAPSGAQSLAAAGMLDYTVTDLVEGQAYRITLVVAANITVAADGTATLVDADANGAADAGASDAVAIITAVDGTAITGTKTVPGLEDDPMNPTGVFPTSGAIRFTVTGVAPGTVVPVVYENGGISTFLEVTSAGEPVETYAVAGALTVQ